VDKRLKKITTYLSNNAKLIALWFVIIVAALIAFPSVDFTVAGQKIDFDGIDFTELSDGRIPQEFQFAPTLDFYGGSEVIYTPTGDAQGSKIPTNTAISASEDLALRLNNINIRDYDIYLRETTAQSEIVVNLPYTAQELQSFNQFLGLTGDVDFATLAPQPELDEDATEEEQLLAQQPQFLPSSITSSDIQSVSQNFGSETSGSGLVITFTEEAFTNVLVNAWSDVNNDPNSRLILQVDGQAVAAQSVPANSAQTGTGVYFTTGLVNDTLATSLLRDIIISSNLSTGLQVLEVNQLDGYYDQYVNPLRITIALGIVLVGIAATFRNRAFGLVASINFWFVASVTIALLKLLNMPLSLAGLVGALAAALIWAYNSRGILPLLTVRQYGSEEVATAKVKLQSKRKNYRNFLIFVTTVLIVLEYSQIPSFHYFANYFFVTTFVGWLAYLFATPVTLNMLQTNSNG
jgi:hypothetical protein